MNNEIIKDLEKELTQLKENNLYKKERVITTAQGAEIKTAETGDVLNFCANNYLGLSSNPAVTKAAVEAIESHGYGMSSVRFICGTQDIHKELEKKIADFVGCQDAILYAAAFDANGGLFEPLLNEQDAIISDELNHASIIDGVRLCKANRYRYQHNNMENLKSILQETTGMRRKLIVTDGVFSMDGTIAQLDKICDLADEFNAMVMIDECHATGFMGKTGRGTHEYRNVLGRIDIITGTFGKALGGASGGFTAAKKEIIEILRQRSRPYLFSNSLAPSITGASIKILDLLSATTSMKEKLEQNTKQFREGMTNAGFDILPGIHPIVPIMLYEAHLAQEFAASLLTKGIYVVGFFFPVVPKGKARIRVQISAAHSSTHIEKCITAFVEVGKELGVLK